MFAIDLPQGFTPRDFQVRLGMRTAECLRAGDRRIQICSPTGTGKTITSVLLTLLNDVRSALGVSPDAVLRVLFVAHRSRLLRQAQESFELASAKVRIIPQSAMSRISEKTKQEGWDLVVLDEAHHESCLSIQAQLNDFCETPIIGLSANKTRPDGLTLKFETVLQEISRKEAAERGYNAKVGINSVLDFGGSDKVALTTRLVRAYHKHMGNTLIFMRTQSECRRVTEALRSEGIAIECLGSEIGEAGVDAALDRLSAGEIQFLVNCDRLGEGVDAKNVTDVILARQLGSNVLVEQFIGRAIRPDSPCQVWEFVAPLRPSIAAKECVGIVLYERLLSFEKGAWQETMISGEDRTWGYMSELRFHGSKAVAITKGEDTAANVLQLPTSGGRIDARAEGINTNTRRGKVESLRAAALGYDEPPQQYNIFGELEDVIPRGRKRSRTTSAAQTLAA